MTQMTEEIRAELTDRILPFWRSLRDDQRGGYIGRVDFDLARYPDADKGCILNSRILWFFSEAYLLLGEKALLADADHAYAMLCRMTDEKNGGVFWALHADGTVADGTKHTYNQAFAIYALSAYFRASGHQEALDRARALFGIIETKCRDAGGYLEAFTADWQPESNEKLSENGVMAGRTMNTLLHVMEGYTGLYRAWPDEAVKARLYEILDIFESKIYNRQKKRQEVFFDHDYRSLIDLHSFGHDIETSWLTEKTLEALDDPALTARIRPLLLDMADHTWRAAFTDHGFANECEKRRGQSEAHMVGAGRGAAGLFERLGQDGRGTVQKRRPHPMGVHPGCPGGSPSRRRVVLVPEGGRHSGQRRGHRGALEMPVSQRPHVHGMDPAESGHIRGIKSWRKLSGKAICFICATSASAISCA